MFPDETALPAMPEGYTRAASRLYSFTPAPFVTTTTRLLQIRCAVTFALCRGLGRKGR